MQHIAQGRCDFDAMDFACDAQCVAQAAVT
jgi:hypothetical protein